MSATIEKLMQVLFTDPDFLSWEVDYRVALAKDLSYYGSNDYALLSSCYNNPLDVLDLDSRENFKAYLETGLVVEFWTFDPNLRYGITQKGKHALQLLRKVFPNQPANVSGFPIRVKAARISAQMTQAELAKIVGVDKRTISQYEIGKMFPHPSTLLRLANVLKVESSWLKGNHY